MSCCAGFSFSFFFYRITVTFNVNNSIPPNFEEEAADQGRQKSAAPEEEVSYNGPVG